jgi:CTP:molybdopterin cytidylyltransferase MocA
MAEIAALILAAGESRRMGRPKALLDWGGRTLLQHQIDVLTKAGCDPVLGVLGAQAHQIRARTPCDPPCRLVENASFRSGRASSVRVGARLLPDDTRAVVVASVDSPVAASTVAALIESWREAPTSIVVPRFEGRNGHPTLFDGALLAELRTVQESSLGLKAVRAAHRTETRFVEVDDALSSLNLNTPEDYAEAVKRGFPPRT